MDRMRKVMDEMRENMRKVNLREHVTVLLSHLVILFFFFLLTFDGSIVKLGNTNILFDRTFSYIRWYFNFYSHLTIPSSHWVVPTSHVTALLSYLIVPFFFSHI